MGTVPGGSPLISEASREASIPHFSWVHRVNFLPTTKFSLVSFPAAKKNTDIGDPTTKVKNKRPSAKGKNQNPPKALRPKQSKKNPSAPKLPKGAATKSEVKREKKDLNIVLDMTKYDFSVVPSPVCSCTGSPRVCYKWGAGGWQSSCCTISISEYPLPMSLSRPRSRLAGRKMSNGAYGKLLLKLAAEGHDLTHHVDLKEHWARHGTNKFVTIK